MATTEKNVSVSLKLMVSKETNKVLFAEAKKDFVDILFSFLTLPLGTIARLVEKESNIGSVTIGSLNSLYHSVSDLDKYLLTQTCKEVLLQPRNSSEDFCNTLRHNVDDTDPKKYFICSRRSTLPCKVNCNNLVSPFTTQKTCACLYPLTRTVILKHSCNGFVKDAATFVITDDLMVMPISLNYTGFAQLQSLGVKKPSSVTEVTVNVTKEKVLDFLKCFLCSKSSLTDFFLQKKPILERSRFFSCSNEDGDSIKINLKLVIRKSDGKILYAVGEKDFADMLLSFLTFPLGGVVRKFGGNCSLDSIDGLYKTVVDLNEDIYLTLKEVKNRLVDPHLLPLFKLSNLILPIFQPTDLRYDSSFQNINSGTILHFQFNKGGDWRQPFESLTEGFVVEEAVYMVTDDLVVEPCSPISVLNLINRLNISFNDLVEKDVTIGIKECLSILKASLTSTSALSYGLGHLLTEVKEEKFGNFGLRDVKKENYIS